MYSEGAPDRASLEGGSPANRSYYHSLTRPSGSLAKGTWKGEGLIFKVSQLHLWLYKIQINPPCHQFLTYVLWLHGLPDPLSDKVHHLLVAQHVPDTCVSESKFMSRRDNGQLFLTYRHRPRLENPNLARPLRFQCLGCKSQFGQPANNCQLNFFFFFSSAKQGFLAFSGKVATL